MASSADFRNYALEILSPLGPVTAKAMFGGYGLYCHGAIFALIADDVLYFKTDAQTRAAFEDAGARPFVYDGKTKPVIMPYHELPVESLDDPDALEQWFKLAIEAAGRGKDKP